MLFCSPVGVVLSWRWVPIAIAIFPLFLLVFSLFIEETPRYYILKKNSVKARKALQRLRGPKVSLHFVFLIGGTTLRFDLC